MCTRSRRWLCCPPGGCKCVFEMSWNWVRKSAKELWHLCRLVYEVWTILSQMLSLIMDVFTSLGVFNLLLNWGLPLQCFGCLLTIGHLATDFVLIPRLMRINTLAISHHVIKVTMAWQMIDCRLKWRTGWTVWRMFDYTWVTTVDPESGGHQLGPYQTLWAPRFHQDLYPRT